MSNPLAQLGSFLKAATPERLPFARTAGGATGLGFFPNGLINVPMLGPGQKINIDEWAGDPLSNSVVARCVECIANALPDAPPFLEQREGNEWKRVDDHEVLDLLRTPNPFHSDAEVWGLVVSGERVRGRAYWYLAWDSSKPREIWPLRWDQVQPLGTEAEFISGYRVTTESGRVMDVGEEQIIHFRHMVNPYAIREGWSPMQTGGRQVAGDNNAAQYHTAILRNSGVLSLLISAKEAVGNGEVVGEQIEQFTKLLQRKLFGEGAGGIAGLNLPLDVHKMSYSPDEMALDRLISYYETRICILMGVDPMVAGVGSGTAQKTYANFEEALGDFWNRTVVPMHNRHAAVLTAQLLPLFGLEPKEWRLKFDYSQVSALTENQDALFKRIGQAFRDGIIDLSQAQGFIKINDVPEDYKGVFYKPPAAPQTQDMNNDPNNPNPPEVKALTGMSFDDVLKALTDELDAAAGGDAEAAQRLWEQAHGEATPEMRRLLDAKQEGK